jgi:hypothetical protein
MDVLRIKYELLRKIYNQNTQRLIIFLTPGIDFVNGGVLSISSIYKESIKLKELHRAEVILCTIPGDPYLLRYTQFNNQNYIYDFSQVINYFKNLQSLMINIPEYAIPQFLGNISSEDYFKLEEIEDVHINIMVQNIKLLPPLFYIKELKRIGKLTCTTAHKRYSTPEIREKLGFPLHWLSTYVSPEQYEKKKYSEKDNLIIVSPDYYPKKLNILRWIAKQFPKLRIQVIENITYENYKSAISKAKWALTFGEGLDGYFVETIFSGGISFAVYNSEFFTEDFKLLRTVYNSYDELIERICLDIKELDNEKAYTDYQEEQYNICSKYYNYKEYINNLKLFYKGEYTYE